MSKQAQARTDMLHGSLADKLFWFALPIAASSMLQQLFNSADVAVVGRFAEEGALAAVGSNTVLVNLLVNVFVGLSVGANVVISQAIGHRRTEEVGTVVHTAMLFSLFCGLGSMALGLLASRPVLSWMGAPEDVLERAVLYLRLYCLGLPFIIPYNFGAAILRSVGDTKRPMYTLIISGILNVCLNLVFVIGFRMGVAGVALATVLANLFNAAAVVVLLCRETGFIQLRLRELRIRRAVLGRLLRIGAPAALQSAVFSLSNICLQTAINGFGSSVVAGMTAAGSLEFFGFFIIGAFSQAATTFAGQNYGAGQYRRCRKILRLCLAEAAGACLALCMVFLVFRDFFLRIYTTDPLELEYAALRLQVMAPLIFTTCTYDNTGSALRGMGHSLVPALITVLGTVVFRVSWVYTVFPHWNTLASLLAVYPISWLLTGTMMVSYYFYVRRRCLRSDAPDSEDGSGQGDYGAETRGV